MTSFSWQNLRGTPLIWFIIAIVIMAQFAITYLLPLQKIFATEAIPFWYGVLIVGIGAALFAIIETEKQIRLAFRRMKEL